MTDSSRTRPEAAPARPAHTGGPSRPSAGPEPRSTAAAGPASTAPPTDLPPAALYDETEEMTRNRLPTGELPAIERVPDGRKHRLKPIRFGLKMVALALVLYFFILLLPDFRDAANRIRDVNPILVVIGFALQLLALFFYALLTRATLGDAAKPLSTMRIFRIQLSTRALTNVVPGGNAAGSALGYRLLTLSGVSGPEAGFALATAGIGSAVVLNLVFWLGLIVSVPRRGVNPYYGTAALAGIIIIAIAAFLVLGLMEGQGRAEQAVRWIAGKLRLNPDRMLRVLRDVAVRLEELVSNRALLKKVVIYALLNWLIDAASLWVFIRAFGETLDIDALIVAFGLANLLAAVPITPGGLGYVDAAYGFTLVGFGLSARVARLGVAAYRFAQFFFPIFIGALAYASLRVGPWKIERRDRLQRLRDLARSEPDRDESKIDFILRFSRPGRASGGSTGQSESDADTSPSDADTSPSDADTSPRGAAAQDERAD